ncbi:RIP metalloprotease RseP [bacterium]|nr:RIP metalloprotease RseP [bacterium]
MSIVIMILLLSFLILVHEAGHFFAARALGIKVDKFGFGLPIGPTLWSKKVGEVEVLVHACLLGGYVAFPDDNKDSNLPMDSKDRFANRPVWQRMIVISAGVIMNIIAAILIVIMTASVWGKLPSGSYDVYVNKIAQEANQSVLDSGLQKGDKILKVNGSDINSTYALSLYSKNSARFDGKVNSDFVKENLSNLQKLNPEYSAEQKISSGLVVKLPEIVNEPQLKIADEELKGYSIFKNNEENLNSEQIKLRKVIQGKTSVTSDGNLTLNDLAYALSDSLKSLNIVVLRDGKEIELKPLYPNEKGLIGIMMDAREKLVPTKNPKSIIKGSCSYLWEQTYMLVYGLWQLFTGKIPAKDMHGIVVIAKIGGDVIQNSGIFSGLLLTALISMDLALVNFLPIPALDGGHFMFLMIELLRGKPVKQETIDKVSTFFFLLLIIFMVLIIFNDIYAIVKHQL